MEFYVNPPMVQISLATGGGVKAQTIANDQEEIGGKGKKILLVRAIKSRY